MRDVRILLTGPAGQLGWELCRALHPIGEVVCAAGPAEEAAGVKCLDLADGDAIRSLVREVRPAIIVNAAAYTNVDMAEDDTSTARAVNGTAPGILAEEARTLDALLVHYSTDYVFDGSSDRAYREGDAAKPINAYGRSKLEGEQAIRDVGGRHLIFRTSWLYGARGHNFLLSMLRHFDERRPLRVVDDQVGAPTWARALAELTAQILAQSRILDKEWLEQKTGTYHAAASGSCTWFEFARAIIERATGNPADEAVLPISTAEYPAKALRPPRSWLDSSLVAETFGLCLGSWEDQLALAMEEVRLRGLARAPGPSQHAPGG